MTSTLVENDECRPVRAMAGTGNERADSVHSLDRSLTELRTGRRLEQVAASIESFLLTQVSRVEESLDKCQRSVNQNQIVQRIIAEFEKQKADWEKQRQSESKRLVEAGERLVQGWKQLEAERQAWTSKKSG